MSTTLEPTRPGHHGCAPEVAMPTSGGVYARALLESEVEAERIAARHEVRTRLRHLVQRIDELVEVCEAAHLGETRRAPDELVQNVFEVLAQARSVLPDGRGAGVCDAMLVRAAAARDPLVRHLMELVWAIQGATFDQLLPWRRELDDNEDDLLLDRQATAET